MRESTLLWKLAMNRNSCIFLGNLLRYAHWLNVTMDMRSTRGLRLFEDPDVSKRQRTMVGWGGAYTRDLFDRARVPGIRRYFPDVNAA